MLNVFVQSTYILFERVISYTIYISNILREMKNRDNDLGIFATGQTCRNPTPGAKQGILSQKMHENVNQQHRKVLHLITGGLPSLFHFTRL